MGLDGTIKRKDDKPLGQLGAIQAALAYVFPGIEFRRSESGRDKIATAAAKGIKFPDVIRRAFEKQAATVTGAFENESFSADFDLGERSLVTCIDVVLYGETKLSTPFWKKLQSKTGWIITHP